MTDRIEKKIQKLLMVNMSPADIFDELTAYLFRKKISDDEKISILRFALNAGLDQQLMSVFVDLFHERHVIPWDLFIELCDKHGVTPQKRVIESLFKGIKKQNREGDLVFTRAWDKIDERFKTLRDENLKILAENHRQKKEQLLEKLNFYRFQRMRHEEEKLLKIMVRMFPADQEILQEYESFKIARAHEVVSRRGRRSFEDLLIMSSAPISKAEKKFIAQLKQFVVSSCLQKNKKSVYNFMVMFKTMGQPNTALELLPYAERSKSILWLEIDLLLDAGKNVECLDRIHEIELTFVNDPETTFAATYTRARALHNLGQNGKAIDLLKSILDIRPDYRSANSLLTEWAEHWN